MYSKTHILGGFRLTFYRFFARTCRLIHILFGPSMPDCTFDEKLLRRLIALQIRDIQYAVRNARIYRIIQRLSL